MARPALYEGDRETHWHQETLIIAPLLQQEIDERDLCYTVELSVAGFTEADKYYYDNMIDFDILERQSLIEKHKLQITDLALTVYGLTELGIEFLYSIGGSHGTTSRLFP